LNPHDGGMQKSTGVFTRTLPVKDQPEDNGK
jgi:hypothetical protein